MVTKFYKCRHCGNVAIKVVDSTVPLVCCGEKMEELKVNTVEVGAEKHLPVIEKMDECTLRVKVGSTEHPMTPEHHISAICLETEDGIQIAYPKDKPVVEFQTQSPVKAVYAYCNLHGLWKLAP
ncbi:MAG: desulfoferrodoxin family protein [Candidatus Cryptobacteroides sp.]|nr:desulfoferrodoxin family protein [Rikenellaceae bacterium]MDY5746363.1 desulfoferrodoxin family protein [Candidatus Cryptobacteroides sp.]